MDHHPPIADPTARGSVRSRPGRRRWIRGGVLTFWLIMMGWLLRFEAFPEAFTKQVGGYRGLVSSEALSEDSWMRIDIQEKPVGYSHSTLETHDENPQQHMVLENEMSLYLNLMGQTMPVRTDTRVVLDVWQKMQTFAFSLSSRDYRLKLHATRTEGETFSVRMRTGESSQSFDTDIPDDVVIHSPLTDMALRELKPGKSLSIKTLDPATMSTTLVNIKALRREEITIQGTNVMTTLLESEAMGTQFHTWMNARGEVLKATTPIGWTMEACTAEQAFEALRVGRESDTSDVLRMMAVSVDQPITDPARATRLRFAVKGVALEADEMASPRQTLTVDKEGRQELVVSAQRLPTLPEHATPPPGAEFLAASRQLQSDHPQIVQRAQQITAEATTELEKALAIHDWVYKNVRKVMSVTLPSALDVLRTLQGDCNEHTALYVALARAAGLPAVTKTGIAYQDGVFYYHAWPAVYVGQWIELEPTWGTGAVDATHIALAEGELSEQMAMVRVMGRLKLSLLERE